MWKHYATRNEEDCVPAHADFDQANAPALQKYHFDAGFYERVGCGAPAPTDYLKMRDR